MSRVNVSMTRSDTVHVDYHPELGDSGRAFIEFGEVSMILDPDQALALAATIQSAVAAAPRLAVAQ